MLSTSHSSSKSIPIPRSNDDGRNSTFSQIDMEHASKVAEWQESQMYQRLLNGMFLSCQRLDYHPKIIRSLENLMQTQSLPLSSLEASNTTSDNRNEEWFTCSRCSGGGDGDWKETKGRRIVVSPDCCCSSSRTFASPSANPSWNYNLKGSSSTLNQSGTALEVLQQQSKASGDEEDDGLIFDFEL